MAPRERWIIIRNWEQFQHYKDDWPKWIKVYPGLLHDPNFTELPESTRLLLLQLFLVYASARAQVPLSTRWLSRQLTQRVTRQQLERLNHAGWIEFASRPSLEHVKLASRATRARESSPTGNQERSRAARPDGRGSSAKKKTACETCHGQGLIAEGRRYVGCPDCDDGRQLRKGGAA